MWVLNKIRRIYLILLKTYASFGNEECFCVHYPDGYRTYWLPYEQAKPLYDLHGGEMEFNAERFFKSNKSKMRRKTK